MFLPACLLLVSLSAVSIENKKAQLSPTNPHDAV